MSDYIEVRKQAQKNIAKRMGVSDYTKLIHASVEEEREIVKTASKGAKFKKIQTPHYPAAGTPYVMLGRKINSKGKLTK